MNLNKWVKIDGKTMCLNDFLDKMKEDIKHLWKIICLIGKWIKE